MNIEYKCNQTSDYLTIKLKKPQELNIKINPKSVLINKYAINLDKPIYPDESCWYIEGDTLIIELCKTHSYWLPDIIGENGSTKEPQKTFSELHYTEQKKVYRILRQNQIQKETTIF